MAILRGDQVGLSYGTHILLENVQFSLEQGEKVAIVGKNGAGKSSLLKLIAKINLPDSGNIQWQKSLRVRYLAQSLPEANDQTIFEYVSNGVTDIKEALDDYQKLSTQGGSESEINRLHDFLDNCDGWHWQQKVERVLTRLELDGARKMSELSGGWRRRVALAECLAAEPELLLLDEPTNHLDLDTIEWLEQSLQQFRGAMLLISHDRQFIDALVEKMWEVDRGRLSVFPAPYDAYFEAKEKQLEDETKINSEFDKKLAQEEVWIRQGIKARRTRNEGRVRALKKMRTERAGRREVQSAAQLQIKSGGASGKLVAEIENASLIRGDKTLFSHFSTRIIKGDKIGVVGPNGCGKSSLIKMILGELSPTTGTVELGTQLDIAYFDQMRSSINSELTIFDNVGEGRDFLEVNGEKRHVISYLSDYGFPPERMRTPASSLSGGEVSRLVLAKLFTRSANLLILDEPTNDLDIETLELLENQLVTFKGTVIVISHDRRFLDNVVSSLIVFEEGGSLIEIEGGYRDFVRYRDSKVQIEQKVSDVAKEPKSATTVREKPRANKLSYKFQRELDALPAELEKIEADIEALENLSSSTEFQQSSVEKMQETFQQLADLQEELEAKLNRWEELESMKGGN